MIVVERWTEYVYMGKVGYVVMGCDGRLLSFCFKHIKKCEKTVQL